MLNDFVDGKLRCERVGQLVPKIKSFIENARQKNVPLFYCNDEHLLQDTLGVHTHICIKHTAFDAFVRGFNIIVAKDGVTAFTEQDHLSGLEYMKRNYGVSIKKISDITNSIS